MDRQFDFLKNITVVDEAEVQALEEAEAEKNRNGNGKNLKAITKTRQKVA